MCYFPRFDLQRYSTTARRIAIKDTKLSEALKEEVELEHIIVTLVCYYSCYFAHQEDPEAEPTSWSVQNSVQKAFDFLGSIKLPSFATPINRYAYHHNDDEDLPPDSPPESPRRYVVRSIGSD